MNRITSKVDYKTKAREQKLMMLLKEERSKILSEIARAEAKLAALDLVLGDYDPTHKSR